MLNQSTQWTIGRILKHEVIHLRTRRGEPSAGSAIGLRTTRGKVFVRTADSTPHDLTIAACRILAATCSLAGRALSLSFTLSFEVGQGSFSPFSFGEEVTLPLTETLS